MPNLLSEWKRFKLNGYSGAETAHYLRAFINGRFSQRNASRIGWNQSAESRYTGGEEMAKARIEKGSALGKAIASGKAAAVAVALNEMRESVGYDAAQEAFRRVDFADVFRCSCCDRYMGEHNPKKYDDSPVCAECFAAHYCACSCCECVVPLDDSENHQDKRFCLPCFNERYFRCVDCGEVGARDDGYPADGGLIHLECADDWHIWLLDGLYHRAEEPADAVRFPNQGADQKDTKIWKWLFDRASRGQMAVELPANGIDNNGLVKVYRLLLDGGIIQDKKCNENNYSSYFDQWLINERDGEADRMLPWKKKRGGTLPKRVSKWCHEKLGVKLDSKLLAAIGDAAAEHMPRGESYLYDIKAGPFDWVRGAFGDPNSCYWTCHSAARHQLSSQHNAFAMRFWQPLRTGEESPSNVGIGRCWILVQDGIAFLFNAYGPHNLLIMARLLATEAGAMYHSVKLVNCGESGGWAYVNNGAGYSVGYFADKDAPDRHDFKLKGMA